EPCDGLQTHVRVRRHVHRIRRREGDWSEAIEETPRSDQPSATHRQRTLHLNRAELHVAQRVRFELLRGRVELQAGLGGDIRQGGLRSAVLPPQTGGRESDYFARFVAVITL